MTLKRLILALALCGLSWSAAAQYVVTTACGTPPATLSTGMRLDGFMDLTGTICAGASGGGGGGSVTQGTSPGVISGSISNTSFAATQGTSPWVVAGGGTAGTAATGVATVQGIASMTPLLVGGTVATNVAITDNPLNLGAQAVSSENTAVTTARKVQIVADLVGRPIVFPYANKENLISGAASTTGTGATSIIASAGGSLKNYITALQCYRSDTGTTAITVAFNDSATTTIVLPAAGANFAGSGSNIVFPTPIATAAATAFTFAPGTGTTTVYCNAQGFKGT